MSSKNTGRIEKKSSRTAAFTCLSRAASYVEKKECYSGADGIAYLFVPAFFKLLLKSRVLFKLFSRSFFPRGIYEYVIARTEYFDAVFIADVSGRGSLIVFDYIHAAVLRRENKYYGEKDIYKTVSNVGEEWTFALEENEVECFLGRYGFSQKDHSGTRELEDRYFRNSKGLIVGKINGTHAIVTGIKE